MPETIRFKKLPIRQVLFPIGAFFIKPTIVTRGLGSCKSVSKHSLTENITQFKQYFLQS